jgi:hypothetical protein
VRERKPAVRHKDYGDADTIRRPLGAPGTGQTLAVTTPARLKADTLWDLYRAVWRVSSREQVVLIVLSLIVAALAAAPLKFQQLVVASDYCYEIEMDRAMARHEAGKARVIPVIVSDVSWRSAPFGKIQALPKDGKAVTTWGGDRYARAPAWRNVAEGIERVAKQLRQAKAAR